MYLKISVEPFKSDLKGVDGDYLTDLNRWNVS